MNVPEVLAGTALGLHHVAIAVEKIDEARPLYENALGMKPKGGVENVPSQLVNVLVLLAGSQRLELVEPTSEESPIWRFVHERGGGIHHLAWHVQDCQEAIDRLLNHNIRMIDETPRPGSHGTTIAFVHPKATGGVLMELVEDPSLS